MAKRSKKQVTGDHMDHSGCIQGLMNIFQFHRGHPSQKLLADKRQRSKRITGTVDNINGLNTMDAFCDMCEVEEVVEPCETTATREKVSVKELMESEMFERDRLRRINKSEGDSNQTARRTSRQHTKKNSLDLSDFNVTSEKPVHRKHKSLSSLDFGGMVTDLCTQISVEGVHHLHHDQTNEETPLPSKDVMEESLAEATRVFVNHFIDRKNFMKDRKIQHSRELIGALQILNSNKDLFLKLLKDPTSQLVKHTQKLEDHQADEDETSRVKLGSTSNELEQRKHKHHSFFWKKLKGFERNLSMKQHDNPQRTSTIIVLKPGPSRSLQSSQPLENKVQSERTSTFDIFNEFKRKLKHVIRKKHPSLGDSDKASGGEGLFPASPSRDHYFIEKLPRKAISPKKRDVRMYEATTSMSEQQISNVDAEAKMTLAEIIGIGDVDEKSVCRQMPKSLERLRSCFDHSHTPICSPRKDEGRSILTSPRLLSPCEGSEFADDRKLCSTTERIGDDIQLKRSDVSDDCSPDTDKSLHTTLSEILPKDDIENTREANVAMDLNRRLYLDETFTGSCNTSTSGDILAEETRHDTEENRTMCSNLDFVRENELSSPLTSSADRFELKDDGVSQSIKSFPVFESIQPRKTECEDHNLPSSACLKAWEEERKSVSEFVKDVVRVTRLTRSQLLERFLFTEHLLEPSLFDDLDFLPDYCHHDPELLFDLIKEAITEICEHDFHGIPSFFKPYIRLNLKDEDIVGEVWEGVDWHLQSEMTQWTLDHAVAKDVSKSLPWMDLRLDSESIGIEMGEEILEELIEEAILSCISLVHDDGAGPSLSEPGEVERSFFA